MKTIQMFPAPEDGSRVLHATIQIDRSGDIMHFTSPTIAELFEEIDYELTEGSMRTRNDNDPVTVQIFPYTAFRWDWDLARLYLVDRSLSAEQVFERLLTSSHKTA